MNPTQRFLDPFTQDDLGALMTTEEGPRVSIFFPTRTPVGGSIENQTRFKSMLQQARKALEARGENSEVINGLLAPAMERLDDNTYWQQQNEGLAVFMAPGVVTTFRSPVAFDEQFHVGSNFHLKPLLPLLEHNQEFYLLALNQSHVRLYRADLYSIDEVDLGKTPTSMNEFLKFDEVQKEHQGQTQTPHYMAGGDVGRIPRHGHGGGGDAAPEKAKLMDYFHVLSGAITQHIEGETTPLILAGQPHLRGLYRDANKYRAIYDQEIEVNPDSMTLEELHTRAMELVAPHFEQERIEAAERFRMLAGQGDPRVLEDTAKVIAAAAYQLVDTLFVSRDEPCWGTFDSDSGQVELHEEQQAEDDDLSGFAAVETLRNGGRVFVFGRSEMPSERPLAAITRAPAESLQ